jgi:hypothetical protein
MKVKMVTCQYTGEDSTADPGLEEFGSGFSVHMGSTDPCLVIHIIIMSYDVMNIIM